VILKVNIELNSMDSIYYKGSIFTIQITDDGRESITDLFKKYHSAISKDLARADALAKQLADKGRLRSPDQFRQETPGFWAIRSGQIRLYGWYGASSCFVISHAIYKSHEKLAAADKRRMESNKAAYLKK
jgi:hypothetical protein